MRQRPLRRLLAPALLGPAILLAACAGEAPADRLPEPASRPAPAPPAEPRIVPFVDVTAEVGLDFTHRGGAPDDYLMPAIMAGGGALFDYDGDGDLDLYLIDSATRITDGSVIEPRPNRLFRQRSDGTIEEIAAAAGAGDTGFGMGCAVADIDNDGDLDLFVSNWGADALYRNNGDGTFSDITTAAGVGDSGFAASAAFLDYDRDGWLDLYVTRYVAFDPTRRCAQQGGRRDYCGPTVFAGVDDLLYRNLGGGRFAHVSRAAGITGVEDAGLGVVAADFNDDGWIDLYVANDADPNNLWINQRDGTFVDEAVLQGAAYNRYGTGEAGMGLAAGDVDGDGDLDILVTHLIEETNTLYRSLGGAGFEDATAIMGLGLPSMDLTGFGTALFDYDNDGDLDLAVANGAVKRRPRSLGSSTGEFWSPYREPSLLFANREGRLFTEVGARSGSALAQLEVSRGLVPGDLDRDGDLDLLITSLSGPTRLLQNRLIELGGEPAHWLDIRVLDPELRREALGAKVTIETADGPRVRHALPSGGYLTGGHTFIHLGLGRLTEVAGFTVRWPDGSEESYPGSEADRIVELRRGEGRREAGRG